MSTKAYTGQLPIFPIPLAAALFLAFGIGPNAALALLACVALVAGLMLLWRPGEPPILQFVFLYQWMQSSISIFYANWKDIPLEYFMFHPGAHDQAVALCLIGLVVLGIGLRIGAGRQDLNFSRAASATVFSTPYAKFVKLFMAVWVFSAACHLLAQAIPGASQLLLALASFKWAAFVVLTYATFVRPEGSFAIWLAVFLIEFVSALGGYFSSFKDVFVFTLIALGAAQVRVSPRQAVLGGLLVGAFVFVGVIWTAIKTDYRHFVRGDSTAQVVTVDFGTAVAKLGELAVDLDAAEIGSSVDQLFRRIMYTEFFGATLTYVPHVVPHENGALWADALIRPVTPRFLFPDKAIIDESLLTNAYTGLGVSGMDQGTQITIGYMGEAYIDFGHLGMFAPILLVGLAMGRICRWILTGPRSYGIAGLGLAPVVLMAASYLEMSSAKVIGGLFAQTLAVWLLISFVLPRYLPWALPRQNRV